MIHWLIHKIIQKLVFVRRRLRAIFSVFTSSLAFGNATRSSRKIWAVSLANSQLFNAFVYICLLVSGTLFAQTIPSISSTNAVPSYTPGLFLIDPEHRAKDIINMVSTLYNTSPYNNKSFSLANIAIQTTRNGLITNVFEVGYASNYTLLIINYYSAGFVTQYAIVPIEQITEIIYSTSSINGVYTSPVTTGILPFIDVDIKERAEDIVELVTTLLTSPTYAVNRNTQVALQTTLTGPYYNSPASVSNGLISNVLNVSINSAPNGTLLLVTYKQVNTQPGYIVVPTEQFFGLNYYPFGP